MSRTRNLQTTNRNVHSPKTLTRPASAVRRRLPGRDRTKDSSKPHAIASRRARVVFAVTMPSGLAACETETMRTARTSFPPRSSPKSADPNEDRSIQSSGRHPHLPRTEHLSPLPPAIARRTGGARNGFARGARASAFTLGTEGHSANVFSAAAGQPVRRPAGGAEGKHSVASVVETSFREHETARAF